MAKMYLMCGTSGAGKTTFAKQFADDHALTYLGVDDFYKMFNGSEHLHEDEFDVWIAFFQAIHLAEMKGRDCIIDTNAPSIVKRTQFLDWFPSFEHHLIYITAPLELCIKNNASRNRQLPYDDLRRMWENFEVPVAEEDARWESVTCYKNKDNSGFVRFTTPTIILR